jgi:hypothetical protein
MKRWSLIFQALWELLRYDLIMALRGFRAVHHEVARLLPRQPPRALDQAAVLDAAEFALSLYWKPVRCLQRSVATARLLRKFGIEGEVVIGCRPVPFTAHAWVEIDGRSCRGFPAFKQLAVIDRF